MFNIHRRLTNLERKMEKVMSTLDDLRTEETDLENAVKVNTDKVNQLRQEVNTLQGQVNGGQQVTAEDVNRLKALVDALTASDTDPVPTPAPTP